MGPFLLFHFVHQVHWRLFSLGVPFKLWVFVIYRSTNMEAYF